MSGLSISVTTLPAGDSLCCVVHLAGEADLTSTPLRDALATEIAVSPRLLLVDMSDLAFIDSAATQMIVSAYQVLRDEEGGILALVSPRPPVARVLSLLGVDQVISVYSSVTEAIAPLS
jgi:anti-anti-sigma factor